MIQQLKIIISFPIGKVNEKVTFRNESNILSHRFSLLDCLFTQNKVLTNKKILNIKPCKEYLILLTIFLHVDFEALGETASLALVPSGHIHHASSVLLTYVVQVTVTECF